MRYEVKNTGMRCPNSWGVWDNEEGAFVKKDGRIFHDDVDTACAYARRLNEYEDTRETVQVVVW